MKKQKRKYFVKMYITENDYNELVERSSMAGLSLSAYARNICLGLPMETQMDRMARLELARLRGDVGKIGGLLKQSLNYGISRSVIYPYLFEIDKIKSSIRTVLEKITPK